MACVLFYAQNSDQKKKKFKRMRQSKYNFLSRDLLSFQKGTKNVSA